jgi:hypothetical protein
MTLFINFWKYQWNLFSRRISFRWRQLQIFISFRQCIRLAGVTLYFNNFLGVDDFKRTLVFFLKFKNWIFLNLYVIWRYCHILLLCKFWAVIEHLILMNHRIHIWLLLILGTMRIRITDGMSVADLIQNFINFGTLVETWFNLFNSPLVLLRILFRILNNVMINLFEVHFVLDLFWVYNDILVMQNHIWGCQSHLLVFVVLITLNWSLTSTQFELILVILTILVATEI